jgi:predicted nucleic acid-binding protein
LSREFFFDTNVPLYLLSNDAVKAGRAEDLMATGGTVSVQVLNEFTAVARRKHQVPWAAIEEVLSGLRLVCRVEPLTIATHDRAVSLAKRYGFHIYDATIAASAIEAGCKTLYSEDLQHGQVFEGLTVVDPFHVPESN